MPKTFTTRKGALLLFSEDMAHRKRHSHHHHIRKSHMDFDDRESQLSKSADEIDLRTVDDLAKSILSFGAQVKCSFFSFLFYSLYYFSSYTIHVYGNCIICRCTILSMHTEN